LLDIEGQAVDRKRQAAINFDKVSLNFESVISYLYCFIRVYSGTYFRLRKLSAYAML